MTRMVSQQEYGTQHRIGSSASVASDERQLRISAFKTKVATLRATSRAYNIAASGDGSIHTLDSSTIASSILGGEQNGRYGGGGGEDATEASRDDAAVTTPTQSANRMPSLANEGGERTPGSVSKLGGESIATGKVSAEGVSVTLSFESDNPFYDSDGSDVSSGTDNVTRDSSDMEESNRSREEEDLFASLAKAFRKVQTKPVTATEPSSNNDDDKEEEGGEGEKEGGEEEGKTKWEEEEDNKAISTPRPMNLDENADSPGRLWGARAWTKRGAGSWGVSPHSSPYSSSKHSNSTGSSGQSSARKGSISAARLASSDHTFSTDGGFSIESIAQESRECVASRSSSERMVVKQVKGCYTSPGVVSIESISKDDIHLYPPSEAESVSPFEDKDVETVPAISNYDIHSSPSSEDASIDPFVNEDLEPRTPIFKQDIHPYPPSESISTNLFSGDGVGPPSNHDIQPSPLSKGKSPKPFSDEDVEPLSPISNHDVHPTESVTGGSTNPFADEDMEPMSIADEDMEPMSPILKHLSEAESTNPFADEGVESPTPISDHDIHPSEPSKDVSMNLFTDEDEEPLTPISKRDIHPLQLSEGKSPDSFGDGDVGPLLYPAASSPIEWKMRPSKYLFQRQAKTTQSPPKPSEGGKSSTNPFLDDVTSAESKSNNSFVDVDNEDSTDLHEDEWNNPLIEKDADDDDDHYNNDNVSSDGSSSDGSGDDDSIQQQIASTLKAAAALLQERRRAINFRLEKNTFSDLSSGSSSGESTTGDAPKAMTSITNGGEGGASQESTSKKIQAIRAKWKQPFLYNDDEEDSENSKSYKSTPNERTIEEKRLVFNSESDNTFDGRSGSSTGRPVSKSDAKPKSKKPERGERKRQISPKDITQQVQSTESPAKAPTTMQKSQPPNSEVMAPPVAVSNNNGTPESVSTSAPSSKASNETPPTPTSSNRQKTSNPFADLLALRQTTKNAIDRRLTQSVGSMNLGSNSNDGASMSTHSTEQCSRRVLFYNANNDDSLDGVIFSDLKKALSKIQSYEEETSEEQGRNVGEGCATGLQEVVVGGSNHESRPAGMKSQVILKDASSDVVSSLKDSSPELFVDNILGIGSDFNDDPFEDDCDDVKSVPKSPAPLESSQVHLLGQEGSHTSDVHDSSPKSEIMERRQSQGDNRDSDDITELCTNSHKADYLNERIRDSMLTPPKKGVVLCDNAKSESGGSISTKTDSILGKTINVANGDLVAERIYLESLRAQVLAELKVHVADEEIRLALDARLKAIRDYYKRKATVMHLKPALASTMPTTPPGANSNGFLEKLGDLPQAAPVAVRESLEEDEGNNLGEAANSDSPNAMSYPEQRQMSNKYVFERVQGKIDEAIQAAHNMPKQSTTAVSHAVEERQEEKAPEKEEEVLYNRQLTETPVPLHIFTKDAVWDDGDDPSNIATPSSPIGTLAGSAGIKKDPPTTHKETIQNAWKFYRKINSLIFDSRVYDYEFDVLQEDPLYPYLNSLVGIADGGMDGYADEHKRISQQVKRGYGEASPHRICHALVDEAHGALDGLKEICAYIGSKLGMQTMAVGPIKKPSEALLKADKKYGGDPLLVTDYCRASLFVKDVASLLALIEIVLSKYANIVKRIKLSPLKCNHEPLVGGYRDCKINVEVEGHICEIQVHLIPMWLIKEGRGYNHHKLCCEHNVDISSFDISKTLVGLGRDVLGDLVKVGEELTMRTPLHQVQQYHEHQIRDYFALSNLYLHYGLPGKAEIILRRIVKLRTESEEFGPSHNETLMQLGLLRKSLMCQHKYKSASSVKNQIKKVKKMQRQRGIVGHESQDLEELCLSDQCAAIDYVCDFILDPNKKERLEEKRKMDLVEESRALWLEERRLFFN